MIQGKPVLAGQAEGEVLFSREPISFWGGYDCQTGEIIDRRHPLSGSNAGGKVLALPSARGSSSTPAVLLEALRIGTAPAAILTSGTDPFFALASIVADEMYAITMPVVALAPGDFDKLRTGDLARIGVDGRIDIQRP